MQFNIQLAHIGMNKGVYPWPDPSSNSHHLRIDWIYSVDTGSWQVNGSSGDELVLLIKNNRGEHSPHRSHFEPSRTSPNETHVHHPS